MYKHKKYWLLESSTLLQQLRQQQRHLTPEQKQQQIRRIQVHNNVIIRHKCILVNKIKIPPTTLTMRCVKIDLM